MNCPNLADGKQALSGKDCETFSLDTQMPDQGREVGKSPTSATGGAGKES
jgi:hypothetical protein